MSTTVPRQGQRPGDNDFTLKIANVNGTGSASANSMLMKSLFRMGIPVCGKNYFPSNIQGLPTWYEIRVSAAGHLARSGRVDLMVAMNAETYRRDHAEVAPGGYLIYDSTWPRSDIFNRTDIQILGVPLSRICNENFDRARARILMKNIMYVGVLAALLDLDMQVIKQLLNEQFAAKANLLEANQKAIDLGHAWAMEHLDCPLPFRARTLDKTRGHIMIDGNTTAALGCLYAGATVGAWYPITPSTSVMDSFKRFCERYRKDPQTGHANYCIIQAEDELSAIGMVLGASWNGARAFTPTSGPGISLMNEFLGYGYFTEIPAVLIDVQRCGPSTGMPTRTQQADILSCAYASHGDTRHVLLFPADPGEAFEHAVKAFDLAERLQTPVIMLTDLDIGMNDWMCRDLTWDDSYVPDRGKVLTADEIAALPKFNRYLDVDGDGIAARTLPGTHPKGAYFTRGSGHNMYGAYTEDAAEYQAVVDRLRRKFDTAKELMPAPEVQVADKCHRGFLTIGSCDHAVKEARAQLADAGVSLNYMRVKGFPFGQAIQDYLDRHERIYVVEQNRDSQLRSLLLLEMRVDPAKLVSVLHYDGLPILARSVVDAVNADLAREKAA
ncbi:MAG: 2-oxoacid:acceptor oxidoreductase subunit alpha [Gammaproteobacteria bacterium PRO9]|nr:2-oxoacid:acceptor oxidoreductase subunit alpha [Gammaproteobacteria bacterium PRO9]